MPVNSHHPGYDRHVGKWALTKAIVDSDVQGLLKDIENGRTAQSVARNKRYKDDAVLTNFTARTKHGLIGAVYRKEPEVVLPADLEYLIEDATGSNIPLDQFSKAVTGEILETGRAGILVDFPSNDGAITIAEEEATGLAATMHLYDATSIINHSTDTVNGKSVLSMVVLEEQISTLTEDGFSWVDTVQYRVLRLMEGAYVALIYDDSNRVVSATMPTKRNGESWTQIPFVFVGSEFNDSSYDNSPLFDLARLNQSHYQNSADYEESVHVVGQPYLIFGLTMSAEEFAIKNPQGIQFGARGGLDVGPDGKAELLQAQPNTLAYEAMRLKEDQALMLGAKLITTATGTRTAEETRMVMSSEHSVLNTVVRNVSAAITSALEFVAEFMGSNTEEIIYELNTEFFKDTLDAQAFMMQIQMVDRGILAKSDLRANLRKSGAIESDRTDEDIDSESQVLPIDPLT